MKKAPKAVQASLANGKSIAIRHALIHRRVTEVLARVEPEGYTDLLADLRAHFKPVGWEVKIVELMADLSCRIRGCLYLETEILNGEMEACATPEDGPGDALARAYIRDFQGPDMLNKISIYEERISTEYSRCFHLLTRSAEQRKRAKAMATATLIKRKPCTSVVQ